MAKYRKKPVVIDAWEFDGRLDFSKTLPAQLLKYFGNYGLEDIYVKRPKQWTQSTRTFGLYLGYRNMSF